MDSEQLILDAINDLRGMVRTAITNMGARVDALERRHEEDHRGITERIGHVESRTTTLEEKSRSSVRVVAMELLRTVVAGFVAGLGLWAALRG